MRVAVGVLTHQVLKHNRKQLLIDTLRSLRDNTNVAFSLYLVDNCSTDGTAELVRDLGGFCSTTYPSTCGHGMNVTLGLIAANADVCVFSNDDITWKPGYLETVTSFWAEAPEDITVCSGHLEPEYPWNTPREIVEAGGVKVLVRDTSPGGTWTFRSRHIDRILPIPETYGEDDVPTCRRLRAQGYRVAQMDVAVHVGEDLSTWNNGSHRFAKPLDDKWSLHG